MKKSLFILLLCFIILMPTISIAANKTVIIEWMMPEGSTNNIIGYNMYYSYDTTVPDVNNPIQNCGNWEVIAPNTFRMSCPTINIEKYPVYFFIGAVKNDGEITISSYDKKEIVKVKNFGVVEQ